GDYDADGVTSSVLLYEVLSILNAKAEAYIPDRVSEGYGLNRGALEKIANSGVKLVITVDGGIRSKEEVVFARSLGLDVIITDHHVPPPDDKDLPDAPIINPALEDEAYPFKFLAGVGVAYKLAKALIFKAKIDSALKEKIEERIIDLVGIGTIADMVSLLGENRILVKRGLQAINRSKRVGLKELIRITGINKYGQLKAWNIGFQIGPRINAAGRMKHANIAFKFLTAKDKKEARALAVSLNNNNIERQKETGKMIDEAKEILGENPKDYILVVVDERKPADSWNEGLIGLVAGRINDYYYRPALVITRTEKGYKGSGRSIPDFNLIKNLEACSNLLDKYGGHPLACGFSVKKENFELFVEFIKSKARAKLKDLDLRPHIIIDKEFKASEIDTDL
ncbi:single-stranded-DNA-specific exonuclease RecJ, partial [bacterium]|nr:single-stranded-DNA-specific exonuclease RecJ [bacterium]